MAVLVDCDNVSYRRGHAILAEAQTHGVLGVKRGYGDWGSPNLGGWRQRLTDLALQPILQIAYVPGKGATDTALIIDAMDLLYSGTVDTFCLVASDSDYTRLAIRLREAGKRVIGIGEKKTPSAFSNACDRFTFLELLEDEPISALDEEESIEAGTFQPLPVGDESSAQGPGASEAGDLPDLHAMLRAAVTSKVEDDGWSLLSNVGWFLVANYPAFDSRNYGFPRLGQLVRSLNYLDIQEEPRANGSSRLKVRLR
ncbi:NYN domain-containing protein [Pseudarthrobacter sp. NPDC055928]|uniref:NYN domain-containing protein n=1 Tax=Pseudarthrobacter sp. NPDC055928 TaxID=3345661 RepID=UPI0035DE0006